MSVGGQHKRQHPHQLCFAPATAQMGPSDDHAPWHVCREGQSFEFRATCGLKWGGAGPGGEDGWGGVLGWGRRLQLAVVASISMHGAD